MQKHQQRQMVEAEPSCCVKFMKLFLIILNVLILLLGIAALAIGVWSLTDDYGADNIEVILDTNLYLAGSVLLVVGGTVITMTAFLGCFGAAFGNRTMLAIYFGIMVCFALLFVAGVIVGFFFLDKVEDSLSEKMKDTLTNNYDVNTTTSERNQDITTVWNDIQRKLKCCGVRGGLKDTESWFIWQSSQWFEIEGKSAVNPTNYIYVPSSCCNTALLFDDCQYLDAGNTQPPKTDVSQVTAENPALYHTGCLDALEDKVSQHIIGIVTIGLLVFVLIIVCAIFSVLVMMEAGRVGKVV